MCGDCENRVIKKMAPISKEEKEDEQDKRLEELAKRLNEKCSTCRTPSYRFPWTVAALKRKQNCCSQQSTGSNSYMCGNCNLILDEYMCSRIQTKCETCIGKFYTCLFSQKYFVSDDDINEH